ncbi:hypothetical protein, partial [Corynebacterium sp.]|uniref:hypothetical protein n=1 Tax=Corynebacterium sp. TaxID=1720 RepID=UPI0026E00B06
DRDRQARGTRLRRYSGRTTDPVTYDDDLSGTTGRSMREQHDPRDLGNVDADGRPLDDGDQHIPRSNY